MATTQLAYASISKSKMKESAMEFSKKGRKWKSFLLTVLMLKFPDYYENHIITDNLEFFINKYSKDFDKKKSPNPIFIGCLERQRKPLLISFLNFMD